MQQKILYFGPVDWFWIKQRPQQISEQLSADDKVDYVNLLGFKKGNNRVVKMRESDDLKAKNIKVNNNLNVYRHRILPKNHYKIGYFMNKTFVMRPFINKICNENNYDVIIITDPNQINYFSSDILKNCIVLYDCMDNITFGDGKETLKNNEKRLMDYANSVVVSSSELKKVIQSHYPNFDGEIKIITNGVDLSNFKYSKKLNKSDMKNIGYVGTIAEWFDFDLIKRTAIENPDFNFKIAGPIKKGFKYDSSSCPSNIKFLGSIPYEKVPNFIKTCEVLLLPFKVNDFINAVNPVKLYEYLAMGKKVLAVSYEETQRFDGVVSLYDYLNKDDFGKKLVNLMNQSDEEKQINQRIEFASRNSWSSKAVEFKKLIDRCR